MATPPPPANAGGKEVFPVSERLYDAVSLINQIEARRLVQLLIRVVRGLHIKNSRPFNAVEEEQLQNVLGFSASDLQLVIDSCSFIFERAAYFSLSSNRLGNELGHSLTSTALGDDQLAAFKRVWETEREGLLEKLKQHSVSPHQLEKLYWRLQLVVPPPTAVAASQPPTTNEAQQAELQRSIPQPSAIFQLQIANTHAVNQEEGEPQSEVVNVEFDHAGLFSFFSKLEAIQEQLDALG